jgi:hypothetical protein
LSVDKNYILKLKSKALDEATNLVDESATVQSGDLASAHVWHFEVSVQQ